MYVLCRDNHELCRDNWNGKIKRKISSKRERKEDETRWKKLYQFVGQSCARLSSSALSRTTMCWRRRRLASFSPRSGGWGGPCRLRKMHFRSEKCIFRFETSATIWRARSRLYRSRFCKLLSNLVTYLIFNWKWIFHTNSIQKIGIISHTSAQCMWNNCFTYVCAKKIKLAI